MLFDLAEGWVCTWCQKDVPSGATITGAPAENAARAVQLRCKACSQDSHLGPHGVTVFNNSFGRLATSPGWNPEANGFIVVRR